MASVPNQSLRRTWRYFIAAWFIPVVLIAAAVAEDRGRLPGFVFPLISLLFIAAGLCHGIPLMRRQISLRDAALFGMITPFGIWVIAVIVKVVWTGK
ncbi:MAG: hypothetical protein DME22_24025 [Verrucomicrobia bacterium]|nr:MAG: hypothetical protein DME22_24025 [Verrucomicrobiota bacterium]